MNADSIPPGPEPDPARTGRRSARPTRAPRRVLVVDDDLDNIRLVERWLRDRTEVVTARGAVEGIAISNDSPDAVLTDFNMPGHTGIWLLEQVAIRWPLARRILMSSDEPSTFASAMRTGIVHKFLQKPLTRTTVTDCLGLVGSGGAGTARLDSAQAQTATLDPAPNDLLEQLSHAMNQRERVVVLIRSDASVGRPVRTVEGTPVEFRPTADGRPRVVLRVEQDVEQIVLVELISRVRRMRTETSSR